MKHVVLIGVLFLGSGVLVLKAGDVVTLANGSEASGKLTLNPAGISADNGGAAPVEINLPDILEADFGEEPFQFDCFFSTSGEGNNQFPMSWKKRDIGFVNQPGAVDDIDGIVSLVASGSSPRRGIPRFGDNLFFAGQPWTGNGQLTARVKDIDAANPGTMAGLMVRETLDNDAPMLSLSVTTQGNGGLALRAERGENLQTTPLRLDLPVWLRLTRYGTELFAATSSDGRAWDLVGVNTLKTFAGSWVGLFGDSRNDQALGNATIDQVSLTPAPAPTQVLPPGVLLQSGSFLAGAFDYLSFDQDNANRQGIFDRNGKSVTIPRAKIAVVAMLPTERSGLAGMGSQVGLMMKNGDFTDGSFNSISGGQVTISSVLLGTSTYDRSSVRACLLQPLQPQAAPYEVRLKDGSIVKANGLGINNSEVVINEISGVQVTASPDEIAQVRAGSSFVQPLAEVDWKANPPATATTTNAPVEESTLVACWAGPNQEQVIMAPVGTKIDFPLKGRFREIGMRVAVSPDSPPDSQVSVRVLADGKEIAHTPPFLAGEQPRFMEVGVQDPQTVTLMADSASGGAKALFIDPVAIRDSQP